MQPTVSIIVVSWNARDYLEKCLNSIAQARSPVVHEVIVVDNASVDGSPEMVEEHFPWASVVRTGANLGFARANNLGMARATGQMLALVNSDALVHRGCLETLAGCLQQDPKVGLVGPRVQGGDGLLQRTSRRLPGVWNTLCRTLALDRVFPSWPLFSAYEITASQHEKPHEAQVLSGCFCMARRSAVEIVGGFDERFFFYGEDIDWSKRFADAGWKLAFVPQATATHFGGGSTSKAPLRFSVEILRATLLYWRKHRGSGGHAVCFALLLAHHGVRLTLRIIQRGAGFGASEQARAKLEEDATCLRWLLWGTEVPNLKVRAQ
jgi:hypothetical protein